MRIYIFISSPQSVVKGTVNARTRLEAVGYVEVEKMFIDRHPHTVVRMTGEGREAFENYREHLSGLLRDDRR